MIILQLILGLAAAVVSVGIFAIIAWFWVCSKLNAYEDSKK
jgi:hypothetical protein